MKAKREEPATGMEKTETRTGSALHAEPSAEADPSRLRVFDIVLISVVFAAILFCGIWFKQSWIRTLPCLVTLVVLLLSAHASRWGYLLGGLNSVFYSIGYIQLRVYGQAAQALLVSLPIQLFTVFYWSRNKSGKKVAMKRLGVKSGSLVLGASAAGWLIGWLVFSLMNDFNAPLSSLTFVVGLLASLLAMLAYVESCFVNLLNYAVSTVMNILLVIESLSNLTYLIIGVYGILQSVRSCMIWIGLYRAQKREKEVSAEDALQEGEDTNGKGNI